MQELFLKLYNCQNYNEVYNLVHGDTLLSNPDNWTPYGNNPNNCGTFENQQAKPEAALVEKLTNSIDAILTKECLLRGIDPRSSGDDVPKNMVEAIEKFFSISRGKWENASPSRRREIAKNLQILVSGDRQTPNVAIYDHGEGQKPQDFPKTFLSLHSGNKMDIPFVQGKFNMGSTGAILFCGGDEKYQLIISRKSKELCESEDDYLYGFTLVRKHPLSSEEENTKKCTWYEYFTIDGKVPSFRAESLNLGLEDALFIDGTIIKMYSYEFSRGCQTDATLDLWRELNTLLYDSALPILICEQRDFRGHSKEKLMLGNQTRIAIDEREKKHKTFSFAIQDIETFGAKVPIEITVFNQTVKNPEFIRGRSVIFTLNGQTQGSENKTFISVDLGFRQLREYMLISVDCSNIKTSVRNEMFMSSRDRMREGKHYTKLREQIVDLLKNEDCLKELNQEYKGKELLESKDDKELIQNLFANLKGNENIKRLLSNMNGLYPFTTKKEVQREGTSGKKKSEEKPQLRRFPSYFRVTNLKEKDGKLYKAVPLGGKGSITFETNVENEFLTRNMDKGELEISILNYSGHSGGGGGHLPSTPDDKLRISRSGPNDGEIKLSFETTDKTEVGDMFEISAKMISASGNIEVVVFIGIEEPKEKKEGNPETKEVPDLNLPSLIKVTKDDWDGQNPPITANDIVRFNLTDNGVIEQILINMDSNLIKKQMNKPGVSVERIGKKYITSIYAHSLMIYTMMYGYYNNQSGDDVLDKETLAIIKEDLSTAVTSIFQYYGAFLMDFTGTDVFDE
ncbi:MAG: hypothetical protein J6Y74_03705 [Clostridia bacterium]|nr:hypothetical protein [Clostridia bacterium]